MAKGLPGFIKVLFTFRDLAGAILAVLRLS